MQHTSLMYTGPVLSILSTVHKAASTLRSKARNHPGNGRLRTNLPLDEGPAGAAGIAGGGLQQSLEVPLRAQLPAELQEDSLLLLGAQRRRNRQVQLLQLLPHCAQLARRRHAQFAQQRLRGRDCQR